MIVEVQAQNDINIDVTILPEPTVSVVVVPSVSTTVATAGVQGPPGPQGFSYQESFESVCYNIKTYNIIDSTFSASQIAKTYDAGSSKTITVTINFVGGKPTTKVLSGTGLPSGINTTCTYDFSGARIIPLKTYS